MQKKGLVSILVRAKGKSTELFMGISNFFSEYPEFDLVQIFPSIIRNELSVTIHGKYPESMMDEIKRLEHHGECFYSGLKLENLSIKVFVLGENKIKKENIPSLYIPSIYEMSQDVNLIIRNPDGVSIHTLKILNDITNGGMCLTDDYMNGKPGTVFRMTGHLSPAFIILLNKWIPRMNDLMYGIEEIVFEHDTSGEKMVVCYDVDDTLWELNSVVYNGIFVPGLKPSYATEFNPHDNKLLTKDQADAVMSCYNNPEIFKTLVFYDGIEHLFDIEKDGLAEVWITSSNCNMDVMNIKHERILNEIPNVNPDHIRFTLSPDHSRKPGDILVDDSVKNIACSDFKWNILIDHPWNTERPEYIETLLDSKKNVYRVYSLKEAIALVQEIIKRNGGNINE